MAETQTYENIVYICGNRGLVSRYANDRLPDHTYTNLKNLEVRQENALSVRFGHTPLTVNGAANAPLAGAVLQLGRLKSLAQTYRYATAGGNLYRIAGDAPGVWTIIASGLSSIPHESMVSYRPVFSSYPYLFIADANVMLKDSGLTGSAVPWGSLWPTAPASVFIQVFAANGSIIGGEYFSDDTVYVYVGVGAHSTVSVGSATGTIQTIDYNQTVIAALSSTTGFSDGCIVTSPALNIAGAPETYYIESVDVTNKIAYCTGLGFYQAPSQMLSINRPAVQVTTPAGGGATCQISRDYHLTPFDWNPNTNAAAPAVELRCTIADPTKIATILLELSLNNNTYTSRYTYTFSGSNFQVGTESVISIPLTQFVAVGSTTTPWKIYAWRMTVTNVGGGGSTTIDFLSLQYNAQSALTTFAGEPYDYRVTYFNANTGYETAPSPVQLPNSLLIPSTSPSSIVNEPILVSYTTGTDPQFTHIRFYRRGGGNNSGWNLVGQLAYLPSTTIKLLDAMSDAIAVEGQTLAIDAYPPITSTLPVPVNTTLTLAVIASLNATLTPASMANISLNQRVTIGQGQTQETVTVLTVGGSSFTAALQFNHAKGETVYAEAAWMQPANIATVAFDRMFIAGDKNNPGRLYYSNVSQPESFPPQNYIDIGDSADPIFGMKLESGYLFVWTITGATLVVSIQGSTPVPTETNVRHGLLSLNALEAVEGGLPYLSYDGVYMMDGGAATEISMEMQWVFRSYTEGTLGPVPVMDPAQRSQVSFGYFQSEIFVSYQAKDANRYRVVWSYRDKRWRWDTISASAQHYEEDTAMLVYGDDSGMVYLDRSGDADYSTPTTIVPIPFALGTASLDQGSPKNYKNYTEFTVDINTYNQDVKVALLFDNQQTSFPLGTVNTPKRQQVQFNINKAGSDALGYSSLNVAFAVSGNATANVDIFELHVKALIESELRHSLDTYWSKYGTEEYKLAKQGYFEYSCTSPLTVFCYIEGIESAPQFTVTLPSTGGLRKIIWVRFPATKATMFRWVVTGATDFKMYESSHIEVKPLCGEKGYAREPLRT
jgi:hypothetical protein